MNTLIAHRQTAIRLGIKTFLLERFGVSRIEQADTINSVQSALSKATFDLLVVGMFFKDGNILEMIEEKKPKQLPHKTLLLCNCTQAPLLRQVLGHGIQGCCHLDADLGELVEALTQIIQGQRFLSPRLIPHMVQATHLLPHTLPAASLSSRERQVARGLAQGQRPCDIALEMKLSIKTVSTYRARALAKMGLQTNADLTLAMSRHEI